MAFDNALKEKGVNFFDRSLVQLEKRGLAHNGSVKDCQSNQRVQKGHLGYGI